MRLLEAIRTTQSRFIVEPNTRIAFRSLLCEMLELTESEYGFIGEILEDSDGVPYLKIVSFTDISWDEATRQLLAENAMTGLIFRNLDTLFGHAITTGEPVIANIPADDARAGGLPPGHPPLNSFLGLPFHYGGKLMGMIGLANRPHGYDDALVQFLGPILSTCAVFAHTRVVDEEAERNKRRLAEAEEAQSLIEFSGKLAHDLNNMLNVVLSTIESAWAESRDLESDKIQVIRNATTQATNLSKKILAYAGLNEEKRQSVDANEIARGSIGMLRAIIPEHINLVENYADALPRISANSDSLHQVITNALLNAIEAIEERAGQIEITTCLVEEATCQRVRFEVSDDGVGMDEITRQRAFEPYYSSKGAGRGFGLASSMGILRSHDAIVDLTSAIGKGTSFAFEIPTPSLKSQAPSSKTPESGCARGTLLIVDDEKAVRLAVATLMEHVGYTVMRASSGEEAIAICSSNLSIDVAVIDISMPGKDGIETLGELRALSPNLPVVLMTGYTEELLPDYLMKVDNISFIQKPFGMREFEERVAEVQVDRC